MDFRDLFTSVHLSMPALPWPECRRCVANIRGAPAGRISEAKRVCCLLGLLEKQEFDNSKNFTNMNCPELSKEFDDVFRIWLAAIPTTAEAVEVHLRADGRSPGRILPDRGKS